MALPDNVKNRIHAAISRVKDGPDPVMVYVTRPEKIRTATAESDAWNKRMREGALAAEIVGVYDWRISRADLFDDIAEHIERRFGDHDD